MRKARGLKLGRKVVKIFKWVVWPKRKPSGYKRLLENAPSPHNYHNKSKTMTKIFKWGQCLKRGAKELCDNYRRIDGGDPLEPKHDHQQRVAAVPKGHLAVYVGQKDGDEPHRFLVPVLYFNHPLFGELLREAEKVYGYHQPGGITIPCPLSEFENVQARIVAGRKASWKHLL